MIGQRESARSMESQFFDAMLEFEEELGEEPIAVNGVSLLVPHRRRRLAELFRPILLLDVDVESDPYYLERRCSSSCAALTENPADFSFRDEEIIGPFHGDVQGRDGFNRFGYGQGRDER